MVLSALVLTVIAGSFLAHAFGHAQLSASSSPAIDPGLVQSTPLYGVLSEVFNGTSESVQVSEWCREHAHALLRGINSREIWALKVMDASGSVRNSFVWGQKAWLGSEAQCSYLNEPPSFSLTATIPKRMDDRLISSTAPTRLLYRMVFSNFSSRLQVDSLLDMHFVNRLGMCVPESCTDHDLGTMVQSFWNNRRLNFQQIYEIDASVVDVRSMEMDNFIWLPQLHWILGCIFLSASLVIGLGSWESESPFVQCFSIRQNVAKLFAPVGTKSNTIGVISGVRSIICFWVMLFHVIFFSMFTYDNLPEMFQSLDGFAVQGLFSIVLYVDVFFVLSSLLLAYNFVGNAEKVRQIREGSVSDVMMIYLKTVFHRYLRLTPALFFALGLSHCVALYLRHSSAHFVDETFDLYCTESGWWHALFYVQNVYAVSDMCTTWTWYLACDMQFYAVMLLLLYVYAKSPRAAAWIFTLLLTIVLVVCFGVLCSFEITLRIDALLSNLRVFYTPPWMRIVPYMAGSLAGILLVHLKKISGTDQPKSYQITMFWLAFGLTILVSLFATYFKSIPVWTFALAFSLGRLLLALCWSSAIVACALGYGGGINRLLSGWVFVHLDRVSYMMFLLNPVVVAGLNAGQQSVEHYEVVSSIAKVSGVFVLSYIAAVVTVPIFETPFLRLSEHYVMGRKRLS